MSTGGDFASGSSGADISLIPEAAIDHVEVLLDGAAAQYGTDAIAGVVNIILKKKSSGGTLTATAGRRYDGGKGENGDSYDVSFNMGMPLFDKGFVNVTVQKTFSNFTRVAGCDIRVCNGDGSLVTDPAALGFPLSVAQGMVDYPRINPIAGAAPQQQITQGAVNMRLRLLGQFQRLCLRHPVAQSGQGLRKRPHAQQGACQRRAPASPARPPIRMVIVPASTR